MFSFSHFVGIIRELYILKCCNNKNNAWIVKKKEFRVLQQKKNVIIRGKSYAIVNYNESDVIFKKKKQTNKSELNRNFNVSKNLKKTCKIIRNSFRRIKLKLLIPVFMYDVVNCIST